MKTSEVFLSVPGYDGLYEVSDKGNVKSLRSGKLLKQSSNRDGYKMVSLTKNGKSRGFSVHRLVALTFIPNPENLPEVNHKDETHDNNVLENLEWCSKSYNRNYGTYRERMSKSLKDSGTSNKSVSAYDKDGKFIKSYDSITEAENELEIGKNCISQCLRGKQKTAGGYIWKYNKKLTMKDLMPKNPIDISETTAENKFFMERSSWLQENECLDEEMAIEVINF